MPFTLRRQVNLWRLRQRQPTKLVFDNRFSQRHNAQVDLIVEIADAVTHGVCQTLVPANEPEKHVSV